MPGITFLEAEEPLVIVFDGGSAEVVFFGDFLLESGTLYASSINPAIFLLHMLQEISMEQAFSCLFCHPRLNSKKNENGDDNI